MYVSVTYTEQGFVLRSKVRALYNLSVCDNLRQNEISNIHLLALRFKVPDSSIYT